MHEAYAYYKNEKYAESISKYKEIVKIEKNNIHAWLGLAANNVKIKSLDQAKQLYLHVLSIDPNESYALAGVALINKEIGLESFKSQSELKEMVSIQHSSPHLQFALASSYAKSAKWPLAQKHFYNAWALKNKDSNYAYNLAVCLDHLGKYLSAIKFYKLSLDLDKTNSLNKYEIGKRLKTLQENNNG